MTARHSRVVRNELIGSRNSSMAPARAAQQWIILRTFVGIDGCSLDVAAVPLALGGSHWKERSVAEFLPHA